MSTKSALADSVHVVLNLCIDFLLLVAYCLTFMLDCLKDVPPPNQEIFVPTTVEKAGGSDDGVVAKHESTVVGHAPTAPMGKTSTSPNPSAEVQTHPSSPPPPLPSMQMSQDKIATMQSASPSPTPDLPLVPAAPAARTHSGRSSHHQSQGWTPEDLAFLDAFSRAANGSRTDMLRFLRESGILRNEPDSSQGHSSDELQTIVPCWGRDDVIGEGSTCPIEPNPGLNMSLAVRSKIESWALELRGKFKADGNTVWLKRACHILDHALAVSHPNDETLGITLSFQAAVRSDLFIATKDDALLDQSIDGFQAGLALISHDAPERHDWLRLMGSLLEKRHDLKGRREDLDLAIEAYKEALSLSPRDSAPLLRVIHRLGVALRKRFDIGGDLSDLESGIHHLDGLFPMVDGDHPERPDVLHDLGMALLTRCKRRGSVVDMGRAINLLEECLSLQTHDSQHRPGILHNLALALRTRNEMSGRVSDLDDAIRLYQRSFSLTNDDPETLNNLASALYGRYKRTGDAADLGQAILHLEKAVSLVSNNDPRRAHYLGNLAVMLDNRHSISNDVTDLNKAIKIHEQILSLPGNHSDQPSMLTNLCGTLIRRFRLSGNVSDRDRALGCLTEALSLTPSDHPHRQGILLNLLRTRSSLLRLDTLSTDDLALVLDQWIELVKLTPQQHPGYSETVTVVVAVLLNCYEEGLDIHQLLLAVGLDAEFSVLDTVLVLLERGAKASASPATDRLEATCHWIELCRLLDRPPALEMFTTMFDLLDLSIARGCSLETRHKQLSIKGDILSAKRLVPDAIAFAIEQRAIETAVEFLERGQSTLLAQLSRYRSSSLLDTLHSVRPDLATRFHELSWQVEHATFTEGQPLPGLDANRPLEDPISRSNRLKTDWEDVVQQIRALDGFHHFLRPTPFSVLRQAAIDGPVILVNISKSRSDAIIVTSDHPPIAVSLPFATQEKVESLVSMFKAAPQSMSNINAVNGLKGVWDTIVEPVATELQDTFGLPRNSRIWWCPTNSAISLPLHAAGLYRLKDDHLSLTRNCLPFLYISSYTSSLNALIRARRDRPHYSGLPSVLLVGQPNTPGQPEIPQVREEIRLIKERIPHSLVLMGDRGTHDTVLTEVVQHQWIHLACHGHVKSNDPLHSHFALHDGPLPLIEIMRQRLPIAEFAFLSACHSASSDSKTPDEFLHLAAGMQFAGFKSVVGTMWAMADVAGPPLADEFYRRMLLRVDHTRAAKALHGATMKLMKDGYSLAIWINFVHWGA